MTKQHLPTRLTRGHPRAPDAARVSHLLADYLSTASVTPRETDAALRAIAASLPAPALVDVRRLLRQAGFSEIERAPILSPPDSDAATVRARGTASSFGSATFAVRGLSFERRRGLLLRDKLRAIGRAYGAPLALSQALALRSLGLQLAGRPASGAAGALKGALSRSLARLGLQLEGRALAAPDPSSDRRYARRILTAGDPRDLLRAGVVQEPAFALVAVVTRARRRRTLSATRARTALRLAVRRAVDPVASPETPPPEGDARVRLYRDVPWGLLLHMLPAGERAVLPRTRDLLRVDLLTLLGLFSAAAAFVRDRQSPLLAATIAGTFVVYMSRIAFGLRAALVGYRAQIDRDKLRRVVAADGAAVDVLADMAQGRRFALRAAAWVEMAAGVSAEEARAVLFEKDDIVDEEEWEEARDDVQVVMGLQDRPSAHVVS